jgi:hypothetical protein
MLRRTRHHPGAIAPVVICAVSLGSAGCVASYSYPDAKAPAAPTEWKHAELGVQVIPRVEQAPFLEGFRSYGATAHAVDDVPEKGRFVRVGVLEIPDSIGATAWGKFAFETYFILPAYSGSSGYDVSFDTYVDGAPIHHYTYSTRATKVMWAGLVPLMWVNYLTPSDSDAFAGIARRFLADSSVYGFVKPSDETVRQIVATRPLPEPGDLDQQLSP